MSNEKLVKDVEELVEENKILYKVLSIIEKNAHTILKLDNHTKRYEYYQTLETLATEPLDANLGSCFAKLKALA